MIKTDNSELGEIEWTLLSKGYELRSMNTTIGRVNQSTLDCGDGIIKIRQFKLPNPIYNGDRIDNSVGWSYAWSSVSHNI